MAPGFKVSIDELGVAINAYAVRDYSARVKVSQVVFNMYIGLMFRLQEIEGYVACRVIHEEQVVLVGIYRGDVVLAPKVYVGEFAFISLRPASVGLVRESFH